NVDVISTIDLVRMLNFQRDRGALATLAVQDRKSSRRLLFAENGQLRGRETEGNEPEIIVPAQRTEAFAFSGVHAISPKLLQMIEEQGVFSIITTYLRLAGEGQKILA